MHKIPSGQSGDNTKEAAVAAEGEAAEQISSHDSSTIKPLEITFEHVIHDGNAMAFFLDFLSSNGREVELLFFWLEAEEFKQLVGQHRDLLAQGRKIYEKYFKREDGEACLFDVVDLGEKYNFDLDRELILKLLENNSPTLDMFSEAQRHVETVLRETFYPKFRETRSFRALIEELKNRRPLTLNEVLDQPSYVGLFEMFIRENLNDYYGNFLFLMEANDIYRAQAFDMVHNNKNVYSENSSNSNNDLYYNYNGNINSSSNSTNSPRASGFDHNNNYSDGENNSRRIHKITRSVSTGAAKKGSLRRHNSNSLYSFGSLSSIESFGTDKNGSTSSLKLLSKHQSTSSVLDSGSSSSNNGSFSMPGSSASAATTPSSALPPPVPTIRTVDTSVVNGNNNNNNNVNMPRQKRDEFVSQRELSRPSSFIDMLPISAAPPSAALEIKKKRTDLLDLLNFAYKILDRYLTSSSDFEATVVSSESKKFVAQTLEKIAGELGGGSGKLASIGGFASISTAFSILDGLTNQLENVFVPAQKDVMNWMENEAFLNFKNSESYAALISRIEEQNSESHRERLHLEATLDGRIYSEDLLVLNLPHRYNEDEDKIQTKGNKNENKKIIKQNRIDSTSKRRRSSYLWNNNMTDKPNDIKFFTKDFVNKIIKVETEMVADERPKAAHKQVCECDCHYDGYEDTCNCQCPSPCLTKRAGGLVFRSHLTYDHDVQKISTTKSDDDASILSTKKSLNQMIQDEEDEGSAFETEDDESDTCARDDDGDVHTDDGNDSEENKTKLVNSHKTLPTEFHNYIFPNGLNVRIIDSNEETETESAISRARLNFRTRNSSDPDNVNGFITIPPRPKPDQGMVRIVNITKVITESDGIVTTDHIKENYEQVQTNENQGLEENDNNNNNKYNSEEDVVEDLAYLKDSKPKDSIHTFVLPCRKLKHPTRSSKSRFWYGACYTTYKLHVVECPLQLKKRNGGSKMIKQDNDPDSCFTEINLTLEKHPKYRLGLNLTLSALGYITLSDFVNRPDGSESPVAKSRLLKVNDVLVSINGRSVSTRRFEDVIREIKQSTKPIQFTFVRGWTETFTRCEYCCKMSCQPTFCYIPETFVLLSLTQSKLDYLRKACIGLWKYFDSQQQQKDDSLYSMGLEEFESYHIIIKEEEQQQQQQQQNDESLVNLFPKPEPPIPNIPFMHLFRFLKRETVADAIACLLLNRPLVMLSDSPSLLCVVGEAFKSLLWPFVWKHFYCPLLPLGLLRRFCKKRKRRLDEMNELKKEHEGLKQYEDRWQFLTSSFFIGICTISIGARDTNLGEFAGFDNIKDWMLQEHDNLRPLDRFLNVKTFSPLLSEGTVVLDIDSDVLEVPQPCKSELDLLSKKQNEAGKALDEMRMSSGLYRYDDNAAVVSRRLRTASTNSTGSFYNSATSLLYHNHSFATKSLIPKFPISLRDILLEEWASIPKQERNMKSVHAKLMNVHCAMLSYYREYFLTSYPTAEDEQNGFDRRVLYFNLKQFLLRCPVQYKQYLNVFIRTKSFASFLVESVYTRCNFFISDSKWGKDLELEILLNNDKPKMKLKSMTSWSSSSPKTKNDDNDNNRIQPIKVDKVVKKKEDNDEQQDERDHSASEEEWL